jgi:hypothetical protein
VESESQYLVECHVSSAESNKGKRLGSAENKQLIYKFALDAGRTGCTRVRNGVLNVSRKQDRVLRNTEIEKTSCRGWFIKRSRKNGTANAYTVTSDRRNKDINPVHTAEQDAGDTGRKTA